MKTEKELKDVFLGALQLPSDIIRTESDLDDRQLLTRAIKNEDLGQWTLLFAIADLCEYAGMIPNPSLLDELPNEFSVNDVVAFVYRKQSE